jgi:hypothetical protein
MNPKVLFFVLSICSVLSYAQAPQAIKYQAVVRDDAGNLIGNETVSLRISIHESSATGTIIYQESFSVMTNEFGLANIEIGNGTPVIGTFPNINWGSDEYFIETELDPDGGTAFTSMGTSQFLSVAYALHAETSGDSHWDTTGNDIYYNSGKVGIGLSSPTGELHVATSTAASEGIFGTDISTYPWGSTIDIGCNMNHAALYVGQSTDRKGYFLWHYGFDPEDGFLSIGTYGGVGDLILQEGAGNVGIGTTNPGIYKLAVNGKIKHEYYSATTGRALYAEGMTDDAMYEILNIGEEGKGLISGNYNPSSASNSIGIYGYNEGSGYGIYGYSYGGKGVYGESLAGGLSAGCLGHSDYGVYGDRGVNANWGYIGGDNYGVYGYANTDNAGDFAVYGNYYNDVAAGTDYDYNDVLGGVQGINHFGRPYTFGVAGHSWLMDDRSGATLGSNWQGIYWGSLAYKNSGGTQYGGYFTTYTTGTGKDSEVKINNGIGAWGDLFGADIHGKIYGAYIEGENYAVFSNGNNYTNGLDVHLQKDAGGENKALYTHVSTDATIQTSGYATLTNGESNVTFDKTFTKMVSTESPIIVTVTPVGNSNGVYLSQVTTDGFKLVENNGGKSNITFNYIAVGKRAGYENPQLPKEVINKEYTEKVARGLHNDGNTKTEGEGLFYDNGKLMVGIHPSTIIDSSIAATDTESSKHPKKPDNADSEKIHNRIKTLEIRNDYGESRAIPSEDMDSLPKEAGKQYQAPNYNTYHGGPEKK